MQETVKTGSDFSYSLSFIYDQSGRPYILLDKTPSRTTVYYCVLNLQGDVIRLVDANGATYATYDYDPYGRLLSVKDANGTEITTASDIALRNPLRYRGYYYDTETGFYYLQSRYYDPAICRFINADSYASTGQGFLGYNMFAYCGNNPVMKTDSSGYLGAEAAIATANWWNPLGWILAAVVVVEVTIIVVEVIDYASDVVSEAIVDSKTNSAGNTQSGIRPATSTPATPPTGGNQDNGNRRPERDYIKARTNKVANKWAQRAGYDSAEAFKREFVWNQGSRFDIYYDRSTSLLILIEKATGRIIETGVSFLR